MGNSRKEMKDQVKNQDGLSTDTPMSRRKFLKKAGYAAPSLIVLGNLAKPVIAAGG